MVRSLTLSATKRYHANENMLCQEIHYRHFGSVVDESGRRA